MFNIFKKKTPVDVKVFEDKLIEALNYVPVAYYHTDKFIQDGEDPIADAKKVVDRAPAADYLCPDFYDAYIDQDTYMEINAGIRQNVAHINTARQLLDSAESDYRRAEEHLAHLIEDRETLIREREEFRELYRQHLLGRSPKSPKTNTPNGTAASAN